MAFEVQPWVSVWIVRSTHHLEREWSQGLTGKVGRRELADYVTGSGHFPVIAVVAQYLRDRGVDFLHLLWRLDENGCES